ncbi:MAG: hypothetical protein A3F80_09755 [Candidatus Melainabacteria bacterium RIFCSPLOWO2_12_FULL_35_11]|nr:MAG: hypothetical protein A3F80_09755 [Candidatus Melainabacteria bacterium RIFCSPLOWO2_12_FULL_35_11]
MKLLPSGTAGLCMIDTARLVRKIRAEVRKGNIHPQELLAKEQELVKFFGERGFESLVDEAAVTSGAHVSF